MEMNKKRTFTFLVSLFILSLTLLAWTDGFHGIREWWGTRYRASVEVLPPLARQVQNRTPLGMAHHWNEMAINASGLDHTQPAPGETRIFGEQLGPARASRAMAIVHIAVFDAVNAITGKYRSYTGIPPAKGSTSMSAAIAEAAHNTLVSLYPSQKKSMDAQLADDLAHMPDGVAKTNGIHLGQQAAAAILQLRANDGSDHPEPRIGVDFFPIFKPGKWRQDPISRIPVALGARWSEVKPFVMESADQFRVPAPPSLRSHEYAVAFNEARFLGGDGLVTRTLRTEEQTDIGIFWAYDGTPSLCAPPRLYNQIAILIADKKGTDVVELTRLLALVNVAMADAAIAVWESKYYYSFWRPVTGIRHADVASGALSRSDIYSAGSSGEQSCRTQLLLRHFLPILRATPDSEAPCLRLCADFTAQITLRSRSCRTNLTASRETTMGMSVLGCGAPFSTLSQAEEENGQSRIYLGIHWSFDKPKESRRADAWQTSCSITHSASENLNTLKKGPLASRRHCRARTSSPRNQCIAALQF